MNKKDWEHLSSLPLGTIVFASPKDPKAKSLPALINKYDLDGDRIFVFWDQNNLNCVGDMPPSEEHLFRSWREASIRIGTDVVAKYKIRRLYSQGIIARMCGPKIEGEAYYISFDDGYFPAHSTLTTPIRSLQKETSSDTPDGGYR